jgi:lipid-binding SYLF domain-containing protein
MRIAQLIIVLSLTVLLQSCAGGINASVAEQKSAIAQMRSDVLSELFREKASARAEVQNAPGYATFSNANVNLILASFGGGYGVVHNNQSGKDTYMKMGEVGLGLGAGVKDFRLVMVFHTVDAMQRFIDQGWAFGAQADAAAKAGDKGAAVGAEASVDDVTIYQFTEAGLALQATLKGTKFWVDEELN